MRNMAFFLPTAVLRAPFGNGGGGDAAAIERDREIVLCIQNRAERTDGRGRTDEGRESGSFLDKEEAG